MKNMKERFKSKKLISMLVAVCMIATIIPLMNIGVAALDRSDFAVGTTFNATDTIYNTDNTTAMYFWLFAEESNNPSTDGASYMRISQNESGSVGVTHGSVTTSGKWKVFKIVSNGYYVTPVKGGTSTVTLASNSHISLDTGSGALNQGPMQGAITTVKLKPNTGYHFLESGFYSSAVGLSVTRVDATHITVTGTLETTDQSVTINPVVADTYTVNYNANGGTLTGSSTGTVTFDSTYGANLPATSNVTKAGYIFSGWYTASSGGSLVTRSTQINTTGDRTVFAHWKENTIPSTKSTKEAEIDALQYLTADEKATYKTGETNSIKYYIDYASANLLSNSGKATTDSVVAPAAPKAELAESPDNLLSKVLSKDDLDLVKHGQAVHLR